MKVLLVDDEEGFLDQTEIFLKQEIDDLVVEKFSSASNALDILEEDDYDVIVSDYQMSGMDGLEFLKELREERGIEIPFIIFTGRGREKVAIRALNLGADRYLQKGGDPKSQYGLLAEAVVQEYERWNSQKKLEKSEREKSLVLESGSEHIAFHDPDHEIVWANKAYSEDLGVEKEDIKGEKCYDLWYDRESPCEDCPVEKAIIEGEGSEEEVSPKGSDYHWLIRGVPVRDEEGDVVGAIETALDITDRKRYEESLEKYKEAIEASDDSLYMIDRDFRYVFANEEHLSRLYDDGKISEISEEEVVGKEYSEVHPERELDSFMENVETVLESGEPVDEEYKFLKGDRWSSRTFSPVGKSEDEGFSGVVVVSKDITGRKKAEESREFLHSLLRHDVRNKIQVLNGYSELLEDMELSEESEKYLEKLKKVSGDTIDLIEKVRALRKTEDEEVREIKVAPILKDVIQSCGASSSGIDIQFNKESSSNSYSVMAGSLLSRVFSNILDNAVQHSGGDKIEVSVEASVDEVICRIEDNGRGISDDKKEKIFEKGYKGDENPGSGLGMFLVKKLIEIYDGSIQVKDSDLGGARFDIRLKRAGN